MEDPDTDVMHIPWHEIQGTVFCPNQKQIHAPNLKSIAGDAYFYHATELNLPNLKSIGGHLAIPDGPMLASVEYVGGTIQAAFATNFEAPNLLDAGGIYTYCPYFYYKREERESFYAPKLHTLRGPLLTESRCIHLPALRSCGPIHTNAPYEHEVAGSEHEFLAPVID